MTNRTPPTQVAENIYLIEIPTPFAVGPVNTYLIESDCLTLVDVGPKTDEAWDVLNTSLQEIGYSLRDIKQAIMTHQHVDHVGLLERVRNVATEIQVYAHPLAIPYIERDPAFMAFHDQFFEQLYCQCGVPEEALTLIRKYSAKIQTFGDKSSVDGLLKHEQTLPNLPEWQVLYTPGHSQSHLSLLRAQDRVMIAGDHLIKNVSSNAFTEPPRDRSQGRPLTLVQYRTALEMCAAKEIDLVLAGHGEPITNHRELITQRLQHNWQRTNDLRNLLQNGEKTAYELSVLLFPHVYKKELPLVLSETIGHLDLLAIVHQVEVKERDGVMYYSL